MSNGTQAVDRAAELLSLVVLADEAPQFADLVSETGLAKSTASRLLQALERNKLLLRDDEGAYAAGPLFSWYAARFEPFDDLMDIAQPILEAVGEATGETVNLAVVRSNIVVQVAQVDSTYLLSATNWMEVEVPPHCSALGKVFYAAGLIDLPDSLERRTEHTLTSVPELRRHLATVRKDGFALAQGELEIGLGAIAVPVVNGQGDVIAAIGVSGPSDRINQQLTHFESLLKTHARALSRALGHRARKDGAA